MEIARLNKTLRWHGQAVFKSFLDLEDLVIEFSDVAGGPGEDVSCFAKFNSVCFVSAPTLFTVAEYIQLKECSLEEAQTLLPEEYSIASDEYGNDGLLAIQFWDGAQPLPYFVLSYGCEVWQEPDSWDPDRF
jgi:hypothetical protein